MPASASPAHRTAVRSDTYITSVSREWPACPHCVAYTPGELDVAHQPDEHCSIAALVDATGAVLGLAILDLAGTA